MNTIEDDRRKRILSDKELDASRFNSLSFTQNLWIWEVNASGVYTYCSPSVFDILGYQPEEIIGKTPFDLIVPEERSRVGELFGKIILNREPIVRLENSNLHKDGRIVILETNGVPFFNEGGELLGYRGIDRDITRLKETERVVKDERLRLRTLIETIPDMIWLKDPAGVYITCNPRFERFFGATESEIVGKSDYDFVSKEMADFFRENDLAAVKTGKPQKNLEWVTFADDGHKELLETIKTPMYDSDCKLTGVLGISRDITQHKLTEDALRESQSRLSNAIDMAKIGMWEFDQKRMGFLPDESFYSLLKTSSEEEGSFLTIQEYNSRFVHPDDVKESSDAVQNAIKENKNTFSVQHRIIRKDGEIRYVVARFLFVKNDDGKRIRSIGLLQDITHIKRAELELRELNASKDKLFSIIAHDLKNPFNTIIGFSEVLKEEVKKMDLESSEYYANLVNVSAVQTYRLLENLLEWANSQRGKTVFNRINFNLNEILKEELDILNEQASGKAIKIISTIPEDFEMFADKNMIKTVLRNLISNAIKFTPRNGVVEINAVSDNHQAEITVSDSGIGMSNEIQEKLFKIEGNLSTLGTENEKGTGLGLLLCKEFVEKHGGKILVESEPGKGSTFRFVIPPEKKRCQ